MAICEVFWWMCSAGDELVQLLRHLHDRMLSACNALAPQDYFVARAGKPPIGVENNLEVLTQVVTGHCQQHGMKVNAAPEIRIVPFASVGADCGWLDACCASDVTITFVKSYGTSIDGTK